MTKRKRLLTSALLLVLLSAAAAVPAGTIFVPINDLMVPINDVMLDESGVTNVRRLPDGVATGRDLTTDGRIGVLAPGRP